MHLPEPIQSKLAHFPWEACDSMRYGFFVRFTFALTLLDSAQVSGQTGELASTLPAFPFVTPAAAACDPRAQECQDRIMAQEREREAEFRSSSQDLQITIQKLGKGGENLPVPGAVNFYEGAVSFGAKPRFQKRATIVNWRSLFSRFDLRGLAEMCCLGPFDFNGTTYELEFHGFRLLHGRVCWNFGVKPKEHVKSWHFVGTIWVLPDALAIVRSQGAFYPLRKIRWYFPLEDHWFKFDSWRKEISQGIWKPDFTCTGVSVSESDFTNPAFRARIVYHYGTESQQSPAAEHACGMSSVLFPKQTTQPSPGTGPMHKKG